MQNPTLQFIENYYANQNHQATQNHQTIQNHQAVQNYQTNQHHQANKNQPGEQSSNAKSSDSTVTSLEALESVHSLESPQSLESKALLIKVKTLVQREKTLTLQIIDYLTEISRRRAYLPKYTSLFTFLVEELGYCASTAMLRINAIRAFETAPEIRQKVLENEVSLNAVAKTQSFINQENRTAKKQEKAPMTKDEQRVLFAAAEAAPVSTLEEQLHKTKHEIEVRKAQAMGEVLPVLKERTQKITVELDGELQKMVEELKSLLSHTHPGADLAVLLKGALPLALRELKIARGLTKRKTPLSSPVKPEGVKNLEGAAPIKSELKGSMEFLRPCNEAHPRIIRRGLPSAIKQKVWSRDGGCCQHADPQSKKKCGSRHQVQFDHIRPWSLGGDHSPENIQLLCGVHNRHRFAGNYADKD